ncbi:MAG: hypothetical protein M3285_12455 [Actinomycetota bacterium]|nr:hypothetical protein [Actinomycetota bacterium]
MKIEAKCETCGRTFLLSQIGEDSDAPGRCPFCGARFARHYSPMLIDTVKSAEVAAVNFVNVLERLQSMETGFDIDIEGLLKNLNGQVRAHESPPVAS